MLSAPPDFPPSRPGIKTLLLVVAAIILFFTMQFWTELKAIVGA